MNFWCFLIFLVINQVKSQTTSTPANNDNNGNNSLKITSFFPLCIIGICIGVFILAIIMVKIILVCRNRKKESNDTEKRNMEISHDEFKINRSKKNSFDEIVANYEYNDNVSSNSGEANKTAYNNNDYSYYQKDQIVNNQTSSSQGQWKQQNTDYYPRDDKKQLTNIKDKSIDYQQYSTDNYKNESEIENSNYQMRNDKRQYNYQTRDNENQNYLMTKTPTVTKNVTPINNNMNGGNPTHYYQGGYI